MKNLLAEIDDLLAYLEDTAHGSEGEKITQMRYKIIQTLENQGCVCDNILSSKPQFHSIDTLRGHGGC